VELDTSRDAGLGSDGTYAGPQAYPLQGRSLALLREIGSETQNPSSGGV
jgi:hypothetical protein